MIINLNSNEKFKKIAYFLLNLTKYNYSSVQTKVIIKNLSAIYNLLISLLPLITIVPIFYSIANTTPVDESFLKVYIPIYLFIAIIFFFDWTLYFLLLKFYYNENNLKNLVKKFFLNITRIYQIFSVLVILILFSIFGYIVEGGMLLTTMNIQLKMWEILLFFLMFININSIFSRYFYPKSNQKKVFVWKKLIRKKVKTFIMVSMALVILLFIFSYIIYIAEFNEPSVADQNWNYWTAMWFCFITITTIGYGDSGVQNIAGRAFTVPLAIVGISLYSVLSVLFATLLNEYDNQKEDIRKNAKYVKEKQQDYEYLFNQINNIVLTNIYNAGLITTEKYNSLLAKVVPVPITIETSKELEKLTFDPTKIQIKYNELLMGVFEDQKNMDFKEFNTSWIGVLEKPKNLINYNVLYLENIGLINKMKISNMPVYFTKDLFEETILNNIIIFIKKPYKAALLEIQIATSIIMEKSKAWETFGKYSDFGVSEFNKKFKDAQNIKVHIIKNKTIYKSTKLLESFAIYTDDKIKDIIYIT